MRTDKQAETETEMTSHLSTETTIQDGQEAIRLPLGAWVRANAVGLAITFALFASVSEGMEAIGADHDTVAWGVPTLTAMVIGGTVFAQLRRRVLGTHHDGSRWQALIIGVGLAAGFVAGWIPPLDFVVGVLAAGTIGGVLQLRGLRRGLRRTRSLLLIGVGTWLLAAVAAVATAILVADVILAGVLGLDDEVNGAGGFVAILALIGLVSGTIGGVIEGATIRRRLTRR
jgi:hypothetical protein